MYRELGRLGACGAIKDGFQKPFEILRFGASIAVRDIHSEVNTQYSLSRPKQPCVSQVAKLPGTDNRKCNANMIQPIQSLSHADNLS